MNQEYQFYAPLRAIFTNVAASEPELADTKEDIELVKRLRSTGNIKLAFETGSFVRDPSAGTDLFIMGDVNRARVAKLVSELEEEMGREIYFTIMTPEDFTYRQRLNDRFLSGVMDAKKIMLIDETHSKVKPAPAALKDDIAEVSVPVEIKPNKQ